MNMSRWVHIIYYLQIITEVVQGLHTNRQSRLQIGIKGTVFSLSLSLSHTYTQTHTQMPTRNKLARIIFPSWSKKKPTTTDPL